MHYPRDGRVFYEQGVAFEPDTLNVLVCFSKVDSTKYSWEAENLLSRLYDLDRKERVTTMEHYMAHALIRLLHDLRGQRKHVAAWAQNFAGAAIDHPETFIQRSKEFAIIVGYLLSLYPEHTWRLIELFDRLVGNTKVCALFLILVMLHGVGDPKDISHHVFSCLPQDAQERHYGLLLQLDGQLYLSCDNLPLTSQEKFKADSKILEILRCAENATATLNRQTITILECLGVPSKVFEDLLELQLISHERAMVDNTAAIEMLTHFVDENQTTLVIADLLRAGFRNEGEGGVKEPFVMNILNLWRSWSLKLLREKARIYVEKSAFLLGCVDETGTLRGHSKKTEGSNVKDTHKLPQIFLQLTDPRGYNNTTIIQGICVVGRRAYSKKMIYNYVK